MNYSDIITGEKIQRLCDIYIGESEDFQYNPHIWNEDVNKHVYFHSIDREFSNPSIIFCYTHLVRRLFDKLCYFKNPFILVSHNSDYNVTETDIPILESNKIIHWYSQNVMIYHSKLTNLPIGIANSQWNHGSPSLWNNICPKQASEKSDIYFYFSVHTNVNARSQCRDILQKNGFVFGEFITTRDYIDFLCNKARYAICPEGNGIDTHRLWECLYTNTIPICLRNIHTERLSLEYPIILIQSWDELRPDTLDTLHISIDKFDSNKLTMNYYTQMIKKYLIIPSYSNR